MKKKLLVCFLTICIVCIFMMSASAFIIGDVDGNSNITAADARLTLRASAALEVLSDEQYVAADVDYNGKVNASDARMILRVSAKIDFFEEKFETITEELPTAEPTTAEPSTAEPTTAEPTTVEPTTAEPTTVEPTTAEPTTVEPTTVESTTVEPTTVEPITEEPTTVEPTTVEPTTVEPITEEPTTESTVISAVEIHDIASVYTVEVSAICANSSSTGSGFYISDDGKIVTNYHVIDEATKITVTDYNGNTYDVTDILAFDEYLDIAILKVDTESVPATLNKDIPKTGSTVYALGSSKGLTDTFSNGIVSNGSRVVEDYNQDMTFIQITAPITNGNSGGPLINDKAEVIGINAWGITVGQNLNFAIPVSYIDSLDYTTPLTMEEFAGQFAAVDVVFPEYTEVSLCLGGTAIIPIQVDDGYDINDLTVNYDCTYVKVEWADYNVVSSITGRNAAMLFVSGIRNVSLTELSVFLNGYPESAVTISLSVSKDGWSSYGGCSSVPDYGAYLSVAPILCYMSEDSEYYCFYYDVDEIIATGYSSDYIVSGYFDVVEYWGFEYYTTNESGDLVFIDNEANIFLWYKYIYDSDGELISIAVAFMYD